MSTMMPPPFLRAPETARSIFRLMAIVACVPLAAGVVLFGWRALVVIALAVGGCLACEWMYQLVVRRPAVGRRSHTVMMGVLLAATLPPWAPWYVPLVAAAVATLVGMLAFGGVGHYIWQPALVGRLAVALLFAGPLASPFDEYPQALPVLAPGHLILGDVREGRRVSDSQPWGETQLPPGREALILRPTRAVLAPLTRGDAPAFSALMDVPVYQEADVHGGHSTGIPQAKPAALMKTPPIEDLLVGARPGGIGETCVAAILLAGLYLVGRNHVKWTLPVTFLFTAAVVAALGPIQLAGEGGAAVWGWGPAGGWSPANWFSPGWTLPPLLAEGLPVGWLYVTYQLLGAEVLLAAFFLATEMTSRPVTVGGQAIFGIACGALAMTLQLYTGWPIPACTAVLVMNTFTPMIDALWRPRVFGKRR